MSYQTVDINEIRITDKKANKGLRNLVDIETGECVTFKEVAPVEYGMKHFWKIYPKELIKLLRLMGNKKLDVFCFILENMKIADNSFSFTYDELCKKTGASRQTVANLLTDLQENDFIVKIHAGHYMINPHVIFKGYDAKKYKMAEMYDNYKKGGY